MPSRPHESRESSGLSSSSRNSRANAGAAPSRLQDSRDLGFIPEALAWNLSDGSTPYELARSDSRDYRQSRLIEAASQVGNSSVETLLANLGDDDPGVRYWGAVGLSAAKSLSAKALDALTNALSDDVLNVRIEAANALARHDNLGTPISVLAEVLESDNLAAVQHAARVIELLGERALAALPAVAECDARMNRIRPPDTSPLIVDPELDKAMFISFSTN